MAESVDLCLSPDETAPAPSPVDAAANIPQEPQLHIPLPPVKSTCQVCHKFFDDPRILPCLHSYCKNCIRTLVKQDRSKKTICCHTCGNATPLPANGVSAIPQNVRLNYDTAIAKYETLIDGGVLSACNSCTRPSPGPAEAFCCTCCMFLCRACHESHQVSVLFQNHKVLVLSELNKSLLVETLKQYVPSPKIKCAEHAESDVKFSCSNCSVLVCLACAVGEHRGHEFVEISKHAITEKSKLEEGAKFLPQARSKLKESIADGKNIEEKIQDRKVEEEQKIRKAFRELCDAIDAREIALLDELEKKSQTKLDNLHAQMKDLTVLRDQTATCSNAVTETEQGCYNDAELSSVVTTLHARLKELSKRFDGAHLKIVENDQLEVSVESKVFVKAFNKFGTVRIHKLRDYSTITKTTIDIGSHFARDVVVHTNGDIFVSDSSGNNGVHVYDSNGRKKRTIGDSGDSKLNSPFGLALVGDNIFVIENNGHKVKKLTINGNYVSTYGTGVSGAQHSQLNNPSFCAVSTDGKVYVSDWGNNRIHVFNPDTTFSHVFGDQSITPSPQGLAFDHQEFLHVATDKRIKVFTTTGKLIQEYAQDAQINPFGITIDEDDRSIVSDTNKKLLIFNAQGELIHKIDTPYTAHGVTLDGKGGLYVADYGTDRLYKYIVG